MGFLDFMKKDTRLVGVDIGSSSVKLIELEGDEDSYRLVSLGSLPLDEKIFEGNTISQVDRVSEQVQALLESNGVADHSVVTAMPGPSVFTKKIKMPHLDMSELATNIQFEAGNFIPHSIDAVRLDFHVLGESGKNQLDVLVVAVKNEIIESYLQTFQFLGLETAVVDVDYFALQNAFEFSYPEYFDETVALINMGNRYSSINICRAGESLFTGDIAVGGKIFTDAIENGLGLSTEEAEKVKTGSKNEKVDESALQEIIDENIERVASEFNRQLSFFWNASGAEEGIDRVFVSGGAARLKGILDELSEKTGLPCELLDPFKKIDLGDAVDKSFAEEISSQMAVSVGLAMRRNGDKLVPEFMDA